jgi:hypothetical protein
MALFGLFLALGGQFTEQVIQALEASFPYPPVALEPVISLSEGTGFQAAWPALSVAPARNQTGVLKNSEMLRNGRLANREGLHQFGYGGLT